MWALGTHGAGESVQATGWQPCALPRSRSGNVCNLFKHQGACSIVFGGRLVQQVRDIWPSAL